MDKIDVYCVWLNEGNVEHVKCKEEELRKLEKLKQIRGFALMPTLGIENLRKLTRFD